MFKSQQPKHTNHWRFDCGEEESCAMALVKGGIHTCCGFKTSSGFSNGSCKVKSTVVFLSQPDRDSSDCHDFLSFQHRSTGQTHWNPASVLSVPVKICLIYFCCQFKQEPHERKSHRGEDDGKEILVAFQTRVLSFYLFKSLEHLWQKTYRFGSGQRSSPSCRARSFLRFPAHFHKQALVFSFDRSRPAVHWLISGVSGETERQRDRTEVGRGRKVRNKYEVCDQCDQVLRVRIEDWWWRRMYGEEKYTFIKHTHFKCSDIGGEAFKDGISYHSRSIQF